MKTRLPGGMSFRTAQLTAFFGWAAFYAVTASSNHTESVDGYKYALEATISPLLEIYDTRSILFHMGNRALYVISEHLGLGLEAFDLILTLVILTGAGSVVLTARLLIRGFKLSNTAGWCGAATLGVCYGFWRFAGEVELYVPSIFLVLLVLNLIFDADARAEGKWTSMLPVGVVAGLTVLYYQPNALPLCVAIPVLFIPRSRWSWFLAYGSACFATVLAGLLGAYWLRYGALPSHMSLIQFANERGGELSPPPHNLESLAKSALTIGHDILSTHWVFANEAVTEQLSKIMPRRVNDEIIFAARHFRPWIYVPLALLPILVGVLCWMVLKAARSGLARRFGPKEAYLLSWFAVASVIVFYLSPTNTEAFISALPPLLMLFAIYVLEPCRRAGRTDLLVVLAVLMTLYNYFGGIGMNQRPAGDLYRAKTAWLQANVKANDLVWINRWYNLQFFHYLRYVVGVNVLVSDPGTVMLLRTDAAKPVLLPLAQVLAQTRTDGGRVLVFGEFFTPHPTLKNSPRSGDSYVYATQMGRTFQDHVQAHDPGSEFTVFEITASGDEFRKLLEGQ